MPILPPPSRKSQQIEHFFRRPPRAFLAAALGQMGETDEARRVWRELRDINPSYAFDEHVGRGPFKVRAHVDRIREGLAKSGLA